MSRVHPILMCALGAALGAALALHLVDEVHEREVATARGVATAGVLRNAAYGMCGSWDNDACLQEAMNQIVRLACAGADGDMMFTLHAPTYYGGKVPGLSCVGGKLEEQTD